jgi:hypothetical protein
MREDYAVRLQARADKAAGRAASSTAGPQSLEDIRREARENWLQLRQSRIQGSESAPSVLAPGRDDDLSH